MHFWHVMYVYRYVTFIMAVPTWNLVWATWTQDQKGQHPITSLLVYNSSTENLTEKEHNQRFSTRTKTWVKKLSQHSNSGWNVAETQQKDWGQKRSSQNESTNADEAARANKWSKSKAQVESLSRKIQPCFAFGSLLRLLSWSYQIPQVQSPTVWCSNSLYDDVACETQLSWNNYPFRRCSP